MFKLVFKIIKSKNPKIHYLSGKFIQKLVTLKEFIPDMVFEKIIRKAAGMGSASKEADPDSYEHAHDFCDVLVKLDTIGVQKNEDVTIL